MPPGSARLACLLDDIEQMIASSQACLSDSALLLHESRDLFADLELLRLRVQRLDRESRDLLARLKVTRSGGLQDLWIVGEKQGAFSRSG